MRILISVDIEGVAGVVAPEQTRAGNAGYEQARLWMAGEANAAIGGAFAGGAAQVYVADAHGAFCNLAASGLDARALLVTGKPRVNAMLGGLECGADGVAMVGYHSRAGGEGVLAHTINGFAFAEILVNGEALGEAALYGALVGEMGVPLVFASGDDVFIAENRARFPEARWVQTKEARGQCSAVSLSPEAAAERISAGMEAAVRALARHRPAPYRLAMPCECVVRAGKAVLADWFAMVPGVERVDATRVRFRQPSAALLLRMLNTFSAMAAAVR